MRPAHCRHTHTHTHSRLRSPGHRLAAPRPLARLSGAWSHPIPPLPASRPAALLQIGTAAAAKASLLAAGGTAASAAAGQALLSLPPAAAWLALLAAALLGGAALLMGRLVGLMHSYPYSHQDNN